MPLRTSYGAFSSRTNFEVEFTIYQNYQFMVFQEGFETREEAENFYRLAKRAITDSREKYVFASKYLKSEGGFISSVDAIREKRLK